jgi:hypothetical protein
VASSASVWNHRDLEHVRHFSTLLKPIVRAAGTAGTRIFDDAKLSAEVVQAWILSLHDVPADVLEEGRDRLMAEGITWMPQPGHLKRHCVAVVNERRKVFELQAADVRAKCERCHGSGIVTVELNGLDHARKCGCLADALALLEQRPAALPMPKMVEIDEVAS